MLVGYVNYVNNFLIISRTLKGMCNSVRKVISVFVCVITHLSTSLLANQILYENRIMSSLYGLLQTNRELLGEGHASPIEKGMDNNEQRHISKTNKKL